MSGEEFEEDVPATAEEKMAISKYFIMDCPPGHLNSVIDALQKLNCDDVLDEEALKPLLTEYHGSQNSVVPMPEGDVVDDGPNNWVVDSAGFIKGPRAGHPLDPTEFIDPSTGKLMIFDPITGTTDSTKLAGPAQIGTGDCDIQDALTAEGKAHVMKHFNHKCAAVGCFAKPELFTVVIAAEKKKLSAFWSGRFVSKWTLKIPDGGSSADVTGSVKVLCHYFEEGNVQLRSAKMVEDPIKIDFSSPEDLAKKFYKTVGGIATDVHQELDQLFQDMAGTTFKDIRRALPINGRKFQWDNIKAYELATARNRVASMMSDK